MAVSFLGWGVTAEAATYSWTGKGVGAGSGTDLNTASKWGGIVPGSSDTGSISLDAASALLTQSANLNWSQLYFTTRSGTNRGTITLSLNNYFGTITARGINTIIISGGSTSVGNTFALGDGTNGFHLLLTGGTLSVGGVLTNANAGYITNPNDSSAVVTFVGNTVQNSGGSLQNGRGLSGGSAPLLRIIGALTNNSGATIYNVASQTNNNSDSGGRMEVQGLVSNAGTLLIRAASAAGGSGGSQSITFAVINNSLFNSGTINLKANASNNKQMATATLSVSGVLTNNGWFDMTPETTVAGRQATYLRTGYLFLGSTATIKGNGDTTLALTGAGDANKPIFANRITAANAATQFVGMDTASIIITGSGNTAAPLLWEVQSRIGDTGAAQFKFGSWYFNATNSYLKLIPGSQPSGNAQFFAGTGAIAGGSSLDLAGIPMFLTGGLFTVNTSAVLTDTIGVGSITIGSGASLTGEGTINALIDITGSTVTAAGSGLNFTKGVILRGKTVDGTTVRNMNTLTGSGLIRAAFVNTATGKVVLDGGSLQLTSATAPVNNGTIQVGANKLTVGADWANNGYIYVSGGSIRTTGVSNLFTNNKLVSLGSSIDSNFTNTDTFTLTANSSITGNFTNTSAGWTTLGGFELKVNGASADNSGTILIGSGTLNNATALTNNTGGLLQLSGGGIKGGAATNSGTISGNGIIAANVTNTGAIEANGGTLNLLSQNVGGAGTVHIATNGTLLFNGSSISGTVLNDNGIVGAGTLINALNNTNYVTLIGGLTLGAAPTNTGSILVGANKLTVGADWANNGYIYVNGGSIRTAGGAGLFTNNLLVSLGSSIDSNFTNTDTFTLTDHSSITGNIINSATGWTSGNGFELKVQGAAGSTNSGTILLSTGTLNNTAGGIANSAGGVITLAGGGVIGGSLSNSGSVSGEGYIASLNNLSSGNVTATGGGLRINSMAADNAGVIRIAGGSSLSVANAWHNAAGGLVLIDDGTVAGATGTNYGNFKGYGMVSAAFVNELGGTMTADGGVLVTANVVTNKGTLRLGSGGAFEFRSGLVNNGNGTTGGVLRDVGTFTFTNSNEATFSNNVTTAENSGGGVYDARSLTYTVNSGTLNLEVTSNNVGSFLTDVPANGFSLGTLILPNTMSLLRLIDNVNNEAVGVGGEAIYVENLMLGTGLSAANFVFGGRYIYYNHIIGDGGTNYIGTLDGAARVTYFDYIIPLNTVIPEPSTIALMLLGLPLILMLAYGRMTNWRQQKAAKLFETSIAQ